MIILLNIWLKTTRDLIYEWMTARDLKVGLNLQINSFKRF